MEGVAYLVPSFPENSFLRMAPVPFAAAVLSIRPIRQFATVSPTDVFLAEFEEWESHHCFSWLVCQGAQ